MLSWLALNDVLDEFSISDFSSQSFTFLMVNRFEGVIEFGVQGVVGATDDIVVVEFATA